MCVCVFFLPSVDILSYSIIVLSEVWSEFGAQSLARGLLAKGKPVMLCYVVHVHLVV